LKALDAAEGDPHNFVLVRHGAVIAQASWHPYGLHRPHQLFSISKSVTALAVGFAASEGLLRPEDLIADVLPDDCPRVISDNLAAMSVRHLLTMTSGHDQDTMPLLMREGDDWARSILADPVGHKPGTHYVYNSGASYLLAAMLQKVTGQRLVDFLRPRLWEPLGITDASWEECPRGIAAGGFGLSMSSLSLAAVGHFMLRRGFLDGEQLLEPSWMDAASRGQVVVRDDRPDWALGYGYHFRPARYGTYRAAGAFGQLCLMMPEKDTVVVITAAMSNPQAQLDLVWDHLLPALEGEGVSESSGPAGAVYRETFELFASEASADDDWLRRGDAIEFRFPANPLEISTVRATRTAGGMVLAVRRAGGQDFDIPAPTDRWRAAHTRFPFEGQIAVQCRGQWEPDRRFTARVVQEDGPVAYRLTIDDSGATPTLRVLKDDSLWDGEVVPVVGVGSRITHGQTTATATTTSSERSTR
jgi:CubicO group peptidase (beta-lactamase class C family)